MTWVLQEEAKDAFKELLASVGVSSDWSWEQTMRQIIGAPRCTLIPFTSKVIHCRHPVQYFTGPETLPGR